MSMELNQFNAIKYLGSGHFSTVYEVIFNREDDQSRSYALKRIYLRNTTTAIGALREQHILRRLAVSDTQSPFLQTLYCSFFHENSPILILDKASGFLLSNVIEYFSPLNEKDAIFYSSEIISGLTYLHGMGIVHMDIKPNNILLSETGHAIITDFDCAFDLIHNMALPTDKDFRGTLYYMAPEVARSSCIRFESDTWAVGAVMACLLADGYRPEATDKEALLKQAREGQWEVPGFRNFSEPVQTFLQSCFAYDPVDRPTPIKMKDFKIFRNINWDPNELLRRSPPHQPCEMQQRKQNAQLPFDPTCEAILKTINWKEKPKLPAHLEYCTIQPDLSKLGTIAPDFDDLMRSGLTPEIISELFKNFEFVNEKWSS